MKIQRHSVNCQSHMIREVQNETRTKEKANIHNSLGGQDKGIKR
ncbi:hypothetical protein [Enterococcus casseliflavus]|nr:hypothetical protein [Enterococcus casseliflavus]